MAEGAPMIFVDYREEKRVKGSRGLWDDLKHTNLPIERACLDAGDLMFIGNGPEGKEVSVGVEFKKIRDLLGSIRTGRLAGHQILKLQQYDYRFLVIEGEWRHDNNGFVTLRAGRTVWKIAPGRFRAMELDKTLLGFTLRAGIFVWPTLTRRDTLRFLSSLYRNWTDGVWDAHSSHQTIYHPKPLLPVSQFRSTISTLPGVGFKTSAVVEKHFKGSLRRALLAPTMEWTKIEHIGPITAEKITQALQ